MKTLLAVVLAALVLAGTGASAPELLPLYVTVSPTNGDIAWVDGSTSQVWVANADGSDVHRLGTAFTPTAVSASSRGHVTACSSTRTSRSSCSHKPASS